MSDKAQHHKVRLEFDGFGLQGRLTCSAPVDANCHLVFSCECESWGDFYTDEDGNRYHTVWAEDWDQNLNQGEGGWYETDERHYAEVVPGYCVYSEFFSIQGADESLEGTLVVSVDPQWEDDYYRFEIKEVEVGHGNA